jgi:hypothetical protein
MKRPDPFIRNQEIGPNYDLIEASVVLLAVGVEVIVHSSLHSALMDEAVSKHKGVLAEVRQRASSFDSTRALVVRRTPTKKPTAQRHIKGSGALAQEWFFTDRTSELVYTGHWPTLPLAWLYRLPARK